jgi:hypothetical protein
MSPPKISPKIPAKERAAKVLLFTLVALAARWRRIHFLDGLAGPNGLRRQGRSAFENPASKTLFFRYSLGSRM